MFDVKRFPGSLWPMLLFGFVSVFWGNFGQSFFVGVYSESFKSALSISASEYGTLYSLATFVAGFTFLFVGVLIDKLPLRLYALLAGVGLFIACLLLALAENILILFFGFLFVRLFGQSLMPHTGMITMARTFEEDRGKALGFAASAVPVGEIVLPLLAVMLIVQIGWKQSWLLYACLIPALYVPLAIFFLKKAETRLTATVDTDIELADKIKGRFSLLKIANFWLVLPTLLFSPFVVTGVFIHQDYLVQTKSWPATLWAASFVSYGVVHWLSSFVAGVLIDKYTARKLIAWYNLPILLSMLVLIFMQGNATASIFLALLGISIGFGGPLGAALWAELYGKKHLGGIRSMVTAFGVVATAISPILFGLAIDAGISLNKIAGATILLGLAVVGMGAFAYREKI